MKKLPAKIAISTIILLGFVGCKASTPSEEAQFPSSLFTNIEEDNEINLFNDDELAPVRSFIEEEVTFSDGHRAKAYRYSDAEAKGRFYFSLTTKEQPLEGYYPYNSYVAWLELPFPLSSIQPNGDIDRLEEIIGHPINRTIDRNSKILSPAKLMAIDGYGNPAKAEWALYNYESSFERLFLTEAVKSDKFYLAGQDLGYMNGLNITLLAMDRQLIDFTVPSLNDLTSQLKDYPAIPENGESWRSEAYLKPIKNSLTKELNSYLVQRRVLLSSNHDQINLVAGSFLLNKDGGIDDYIHEVAKLKVGLYGDKPLASMNSIYKVGLMDLKSDLAIKKYEESYKTLFKKHGKEALELSKLLPEDAIKLKDGVNLATFMQLTLTSTDGLQSVSPWLLIEAKADDAQALPANSEAFSLDHAWVREHLSSVEKLASYENLTVSYLDAQMKIVKIRYDNLFTISFESENLFEFNKAYALYQRKNSQHENS